MEYLDWSWSLHAEFCLSLRWDRFSTLFAFKSLGGLISIVSTSSLQKYYAMNGNSIQKLNKDERTPRHGVDGIIMQCRKSKTDFNFAQKALLAGVCIEFFLNNNKFNGLRQVGDLVLHLLFLDFQWHNDALRGCNWKVNRLRTWPYSQCEIFHKTRSRTKNRGETWVRDKFRAMSLRCTMQLISAE